MSDRSLIFAGALLALPAGTPSSAAPLVATPITVQGDFQGEKVGKPAKDLSGIACAAPSGQERRCLVIDDEMRSAQYATLGPAGLTVRDTMPLTVSGLPTAVGSAPTAPDKVTVGDESALDGEAIAYDGTNYYIAGSAGLSRKKVEFQQSSFLVARVTPGGSTSFSYRLADALQAAAGVSNYFLKPLNGAEGAKVEGLAVSGDDLIVGLRAPNLEGDGLLVITSITDVFVAGSQRLGEDAKVERIKIGEGNGIRDLAMLPNATVLVLTGPMLDEPTTLGRYRLLTYDRATSATTELGTLPDVKDKDGEFAKAEGVAVLNKRGKIVDLLILYDGMPNGAPQEVTVTLP